MGVLSTPRSTGNLGVIYLFTGVPWVPWERVLSPKLARDLFERARKGKFVEETLKIPVLDGTYG
jgi:hypothetical protein